MKTRYQALLALFVLSLAGGLIYSANHYNSKYQTEKLRADKAESLATNLLVTINEMQKRQREAAALDAKYTGELADAKRTIEDLQRDVAAGTRRVYIKASCPTSTGGEASTGSVGHATAARPDDGVEQHYWRLRERIGVVTKQVSYLQDYIKEQCFYR